MHVKLPLALIPLLCVLLLLEDKVNLPNNYVAEQM